MGLIIEILGSFALGLLTPLTAVCVLPLYPGFLAYLANKFNSEETREKRGKKHYALFGFLVTLGVILFMLLFGILFTTILQVSLTNAIGIISPIAFGIMGIISLFLIFDFDFGRYIPQMKLPSTNNPVFSALSYGFFFGAIVIPCNPGFIATFLARSFLFENFARSILNFVLFGFGMGFPLLLFSLVSVKWSSNIISFLTRNKRRINLTAGIILLGISIYYVFFVFKVLG